jgi:hypothetical protein
MRSAPFASVVLSLGLLIILGQPITTRAAENGTAISGYVFLDSNKNGQFDFGELPAPGRTVQLSRWGHGDRYWRSIDEVKSAAQGHYRFDHVPLGVSRLNVGVRTDEQTDCLTGDTEGIDTRGGGALRGKTVSPGATVDLGVLARGDGAATGTFTNDLNENGVRDPGEPPLEGWKVTIEGSETPNVVCYSEATTRSDGSFQLDVNVDRMNWFSVSPPSSVGGPWEWIAPTKRSGNAVAPSDQRDRPDFVQKGQKLDVMIHFSTGSASLSGTAFRDLDGDGVQDPGEPSLDCRHAESLLQLSRELPGVGAIEVNTKATCETNGEFTFSDLEGGDYRVAIVCSVQLPERYEGWVGKWASVADQQQAKDYLVALCPDSRCPQPPVTFKPPPTPMERRPTGVPIIMPPTGNAGSRSNHIATLALLLAMTGLASMITAGLLRAGRTRRD